MAGDETIMDALTGAYSRALLAPRLAEELARAARSHTGCSLFLFDVDYFKSVNDAYGHQRGDEILRQLCDRINGLIRAYDVLFRYGGDEFVLLLPDTGQADAVRVALRLTEGVKAAEFAGEPPLAVSVSLGVAVFPEDATDADGLLAAADRRNYLAKHRGRACAVADDDVAPAESAARPTSSRLLERDVPLSGVRDFLTRLVAGDRGTLELTGERGAGYTRFLTEVARAGRLRGFEVVEAVEAGDVRIPDTTRPVLVVLDGPADERIAGHAAGPLGVVHHGGSAGLPVLDTVELLPWSPAAIKVWLRTTLQAEPSRVLVDWLASRTGGLPARVAREIDRLTGNGGLVRDGEGGWTVAPALLHRGSRPHRPLPAPLTELVGRQRETAQVARLITDHRLVTLVGPGGIGKTRLSLAVATAVADGFADGAAFVPVADARTADEVLAAITRAVEAPDLPGRSAAESIAAHLAEQSVLLVLDNVEQAPGAADVLADLLAAAPGVSVLLSTRERLGLYGEQVYQVPALALPDPATLPPGAAGVALALAGSPALALFAARARAVANDFAVTAGNLRSVIDLCRRLDGLPLAIELTAAHADTLSPAELLAQLGTALDLPGPGLRGVPERQRTLRGAIEWSVALLSAEERDLFLRLGAFRGGAVRDAIAFVAPAGPSADAAERSPRSSGPASQPAPGADPDQLTKRLDSLVDKSLVRAEPDPVDGSRFVLLETMRAYAAERLPADAVALHAAYFAQLATTAGRELTGPAQAQWHARLDREYGNLGTALAAGTPDLAAQTALGLWRYWRNGSSLRDGRRWLDQLLGGEGDGVIRAQLLHAAAVLAGAQDEHESATRFALQSRELARTLGDRRTVAQAANALGIAALSAGDCTAAREYFVESLDRWTELAEPLGMAMAHGNLTKVALRSGAVATASEHADQCLSLDRASGNSRGIMLGQLCLGEIRLLRGDLGGARTALAEALALARSLGDVFGEAMARHQLGLVALAAGRTAEALTQVATAAGLRRDVGDRDDLAMSLDTLARLLAPSRPALAARLLGAAETVRVRHRLAPGADLAPLRETLLAGLGAAAFEVAVATGRAAALDTVVDEALDAA
jgi:diguanylate cyclase (GGDEF)-like protein